MSKSKVAAVAALVAIIVAAAVLLVRAQTRGETPPDAVLQATSERIMTTAPYEVRKFSNEQWMKMSVDPATGYRSTDGRLWAERITCANCKEPIPTAPIKAGADTGLGVGKYKCPRCGKPAFVAD